MPSHGSKNGAASDTAKAIKLAPLPKELEELLESSFKSPPIEEVDKWFEGLSAKDRQLYEDGVEACIKGGLTIAAKRSFDNLVRQKRTKQEENVRRGREKQKQNIEKPKFSSNNHNHNNNSNNNNGQGRNEIGNLHRATAEEKRRGFGRERGDSFRSNSSAPVNAMSQYGPPAYDPFRVMLHTIHQSSPLGPRLLPMIDYDNHNIYHQPPM
jgi:hypothetical protein